MIIQNNQKNRIINLTEQLKEKRMENTNKSKIDFMNVQDKFIDIKASLN